MISEVIVISSTYWIGLFVLIICCVVIPQRKFLLAMIRRKRKEGKGKMPNELLREFLGKDCSISLFHEIAAVQGKILAVEENWIKVEEKKRIRLINGDMIRDISTAK